MSATEIASANPPAKLCVVEDLEYWKLLEAV